MSFLRLLSSAVYEALVVLCSPRSCFMLPPSVDEAYTVFQFITLHMDTRPSAFQIPTQPFCVQQSMFALVLSQCLMFLKADCGQDKKKIRSMPLTFCGLYVRLLACNDSYPVFLPGP